MTRIKVNHVKVHKYTELEDDVPSFEKAIVAEGRLVILHSKGLFSPEESRVNSLLWNTKTDKYERGIQEQNSGMVALTLTTSGLHFNGILMQCKPVVVSELETTAERGDWLLDKDTKDFFQYEGALTLAEINITNYWKVLVLPEQFSPEQLQAIIDGKLKNDDKVLVQCKQSKTRWEQGGTVVGNFITDTVIKLDEQSHVILHPGENEDKHVEKKFSREEVMEIAAKAWYTGKKRSHEFFHKSYVSFEEWKEHTDFYEWFKQNF